MRALKATLIYFAAVFGVGFVLGAIRLPLLVPRLGVRVAELLELPVMLAASFFLAGLVARRWGPFSLAQRFFIGIGALLLMVAAELAMVLVVLGQPLDRYLAGRDPVSGTAYVLSLLAFAVMPLLARRDLKPVPRQGSR